MSNKEQGPNSHAFRHICEQHIDEAAHLWSIWNQARRQPHFDHTSLKEIELRVQAHIAGMRIYGDLAWHICESALDIADAGEIFAAAQLAFRSYDVERIKTIVELAAGNDQLEPGLISALAWLPADVVHPWLKKFLESKALSHKAMALEVCRLRGEDPAAYLTRILQREDCQANTFLMIKALQCAGEFKRTDLLHEVKILLDQLHEDTGQFWCLYALVLLEQSQYVAQLKPFVMAGPVQERAIDIAFRCLNIETARTWIREMVTLKIDNQWIVQATQTLADPQAIPWLIGLMTVENYARIAGFAFFSITGVELEENELALAEPLSLEKKIEKEIDADESPDMPIEEHLIWPDAPKIRQAWQQLATRYENGQRYLLGMALNEQNLKAAWANGCQPHRQAAAMELALHYKFKLLNAQACAAPER